MDNSSPQKGGFVQEKGQATETVVFFFFFQGIRYFLFVLVSLLAEGDTFTQTGETAGGLGEDHATLWAVDDGVGVGKEWGDGMAAGALDVHVE